MVTSVRSLHVWSSLTCPLLPDSGEVHLGVRVVLLLMRDRIAGSVLHGGHVGIVRRADRVREIARRDRGRAVLLDPGVGDPLCVGEVAGKRRRGRHGRRSRRARLAETFLVLVVVPAGGEGEHEHGDEWDECELLHLVCGILGKVADKGSSFTGAYVMSRKRAKYTSSSTTPSWLTLLNDRSSPFAPSVVTSSSAVAIFRRIGGARLQDGRGEQVDEVVGIHPRLRRLDHLDVLRASSHRRGRRRRPPRTSVRTSRTAPGRPLRSAGRPRT